MSQEEIGVISEFIANKRISKGLNRNQLADLVGVDWGTVENWETGIHKPGGENLIKLSEVLEVPPKDILNPPPEAQGASPGNDLPPGVAEPIFGWSTSPQALKIAHSLRATILPNLEDGSLTRTQAMEMLAVILRESQVKLDEFDRMAKGLIDAIIEANQKRRREDILEGLPLVLRVAIEAHWAKEEKA